MISHDGEVKKFKSEYVYTKKKASSLGGWVGAHPFTLPLEPPLLIPKRRHAVATDKNYIPIIIINTIWVSREIYLGREPRGDWGGDELGRACRHD